MTDTDTPTTRRLSRVLTPSIIVSLFVFGTYDRWIAPPGATSPVFLLSGLLVLLGLVLWLYGDAALHHHPSDRPGSGRLLRVQKPYLEEIFFWLYVLVVWAPMSFGELRPLSLLLAGGLVLAMGLVRLLYAKGKAIW
jgi:hypothetical protein